MARYTVPKVYYQSGINANTAVEVAYIKSLSWANKTNNGGNFELIIPMDSSLTPFNPSLDGYIRLAPGDTIMQIEKRKRICDEKGNRWYQLGGRATQQTDDIVRDAKNNGYYFRYVYNGSNSEQYSTSTVKAPVTTINSGDILTSNTYEDDLGGFTEVIEDTVHEAYSWGTIITGQPKVIVNTVTKSTVISVTWGPNATQTINMGRDFMPHPDAGTTATSVVSVQTHEPFVDVSNVPQIVVGAASGANGKMDRIEYKGSWFKNDVTTDVTLDGQFYSWTVHYYDRNAPNGINFHIGTSQGRAIIPKRTITLKTDQEYLAEMQALLTPQSSGSMPKKINQQITTVTGGHAGYSFTIKSKGEVSKRYKVDFKLGDTISVNDTRLGVVYTGVVSGAVETIDSNGYSVDIEIGTLGATLEQRVNKVI